MRILIANRGEIARRIIRTADRLGHETVAVFADPDADAPHVEEATMSAAVGPAGPDSGYLSSDAVLTAASECGADAVHPGYGFLSESPDFARRVEQAGLTWVGPHPAAIESMGSKIEARRLAESAGVPVIPGFDRSQDDDALADAAEAIGYPVLVKAAAGGGGKGIRVVDDPSEFAARLREARLEAERSFGDRAVIVERFVQQPRHVEVQVIGDRHGTVVDLGTRECSVQRRYQKLMEEAPAPNLDDETRTGLRSSAVGMARAIGYDSAGTVEFVVDDRTGDYFFLEMNTRLQVEHPVTEAVTGLDLVELMIRSAMGEPLAVSQSSVVLTGHAFEVRINAEDVGAGFAPGTGEITHLVVPSGVRWDSAVEIGSVVGPHFDSMIAKLITHGETRDEALASLRRGLDRLVLGGVPTTAGLHRWLVDQPPVREGRVTTRFLDETEPPAPPPAGPAAGAAALAWLAGTPAHDAYDPWRRLTGFRVTPHRPNRLVLLRADDGEIHELSVEPEARPEARPELPTSVDRESRSIAVNRSGHGFRFSVLTRSEAWTPRADVGHGHAGVVTAPFPAVVAQVRVGPGDSVAGGDVVVVIEAMKMLHSLATNGPGVVDEVRVEAGAQVDTNQVLVTFEPTAADRTGDRR